MVTAKYIASNGSGHYEVTNGIHTVSCDIGELDETIRELEDELFI